MLRSTPRTKTYDQDFFLNAKNETEVHYQSLKTKISSTRHKQDFEIHFEFKCSNGHQMVNIEFFILYFDLNLN
jgi:hypothetical protein